LNLYLKLVYREIKRYKNSSNPDPKELVRWKLKSGITWEVVESQGEITEEILEKYFDKIVD
jgi:hypothetical protein